MEFLRFIFSSFWVWLGFVILVAVVGGGLAELVKACKRNRKITSYQIGQHWHVQIENASVEDVQQAIVSAAYAQGGEAEQEERNDV